MVQREATRQNTVPLLAKAGHQNHRQRQEEHDKQYASHNARRCASFGDQISMAGSLRPVRDAAEGDTGENSPSDEQC